MQAMNVDLPTRRWDPFSRVRTPSEAYQLVTSASIVSRISCAPRVPAFRGPAPWRRSPTPISNRFSRTAPKVKGPRWRHRCRPPFQKRPRRRAPGRHVPSSSHPEGVGAGSVAPFVSPAESGFGPDQVAGPLEEESEVERTVSVTQQVGSTIGLDGAGDVTFSRRAVARGRKPRRRSPWRPPSYMRPRLRPCRRPARAALPGCMHLLRLPRPSHRRYAASAPARSPRRLSSTPRKRAPSALPRSSAPRYAAPAPSRSPLSSRARPRWRYLSPLAGGCRTREAVDSTPRSETRSVHRVPSQYRCSWPDVGSAYHPGGARPLTGPS